MKILIDEVQNDRVHIIAKEIQDRDDRWHIVDISLDIMKEYTVNTGGNINLESKYVLYEVESVPEYVEPDKYCYTPEKGFYKNEKYVYTFTEEERISALEDMMNEILLGGM